MNRIEHFVPNGTINIHCIEVNCPKSGDSIPLIIIPGATNSAEHMEEDFAGNLSRHHIYISLRGRGKSGSPKAGYKLDHHVSDVLAVLEALEIKSCYLFGFSIGSTVAVRTTAQKGAIVKALIMGDYPPFFPPFDSKWAARVREHEDRAISEVAIDGIANEGEYTEASGDFEQISCPVMLVKGGRDGSLFPEEALPYLEKLVKSPLTVRILEDSDHYIFEPHPSILVDEIEDFIGENR